MDRLMKAVRQARRLGISMTGFGGSRGLRMLALLMVSASLAGCASSGGGLGGFAGGSSAKYAEMNDGGHVLPAIDISEISPDMLRQPVEYRTREPAGTIVVDTAA